MTRFGLEFHHLGLAVKTPDRARAFLKDLGYEIGDTCFDPEQKVNLIFCRGGLMPDVEIIFPSESPSPIDGILARFDQLIYHLCYVTDDLAEAVRKIKSAHRVLPISPPKPAVLFDNRLVAFFQVAGFGLIEILERRKRQIPDDTAA